MMSLLWLLCLVSITVVGFVGSDVTTYNSSREGNNLQEDKRRDNDSLLSQVILSEVISSCCACCFTLKKSCKIDSLIISKLHINMQWGFGYLGIFDFC